MNTGCCKHTYEWVARKVAHVGAYCANELFPIRCGICGKVGVAMCDTCGGAYVGAWQMTPHPCVPDVPVFYLKAYQYQPMRQCIAASKYRGRPDMLDEVINRLCGYLPNTTGAVLVPVPITRVHFARRGYNQAALLAQAISRRYAMPWVDAIRWREMAMMHSHTGATREERLRVRPVCIKKRYLHGGMHVIVVDDVVTTGATTRDVIRALQERGAIVRAVVALAITQVGGTPGRT